MLHKAQKHVLDIHLNITTIQKKKKQDMKKESQVKKKIKITHKIWIEK